MGHGARGLQRDGDAWDYFPHDMRAAARIAGARTASPASAIDRQRLCLALALWNGRDPILKERLFGLTNAEGNHGEDVKELYYYLDAHADAFLHEDALQVSAAGVSLCATGRGEPRGAARDEPEYELLDTGVFDDDRYFDVDGRICQGRRPRTS